MYKYNKNKTGNAFPLKYNNIIYTRFGEFSAMTTGLLSYFILL